MNLKTHLKRKIKALWARLYRSTNTKVDVDPNCKNIIPLNENILDLANTFLNQGRYQEAIMLFEHALRMEPKKADICFNLGQCYSNLSQPGKSISFYIQAIALNPEWSVPYLYLALIQKNLKKYDEALQNCKLSINL